MKNIWLLGIVSILAGCKQDNATVFPNLFIQNGEVQAIYIADTEDGTELRLNHNTIAKGEDWVVNWADFPSAVEYADGKLAAHYLVMKDPEVFAYDVEIILSNDGGQTWSTPFTPHTDKTLTEHGFVSLAGVGGKLMAVWLDGRAYAEGEDRMELRGALISSEGRLEAEYLIDDNVCSCCGTEIASNDDTIFLVYRDRYEGEMRDMSLVKYDMEEGSWGDPRRIHEDGWSIAACPVNGPSIECDGEELHVAWYTEIGDVSAVYYAVSRDGGESFEDPRRVDEGETLGRVDCAILSGGRVAVSSMEYVENDIELADIKVKIFEGEEAQRSTVVGSTSSSRASGFPKIKNAPGEPNALVVSYTKVNNSGQGQVPEVIISKVGI